jgi:hypothetical protein
MDDKERRRAYAVEYRIKNAEWISDKRRIKAYGTDGKDLWDKQKGLCAICEEPLPSRYNREAALDHCHETGKVRGWLCRACNVAIGKLKTPMLLEFAITYLTNEDWYDA